MWDNLVHFGMDSCDMFPPKITSSLLGDQCYDYIAVALKTQLDNNASILIKTIMKAIINCC